MANGECDKVELPALKQLQALGWICQHGLQLAPMTFAENSEREYFCEMVLEKRLQAALRRINPWISEKNLRKLMREMTHPAFQH